MRVNRNVQLITRNSLSRNALQIRGTFEEKPRCVSVLLSAGDVHVLLCHAIRIIQARIYPSLELIEQLNSRLVSGRQQLREVYASDSFVDVDPLESISQVERIPLCIG
jgi:hypothetical protein